MSQAVRNEDQREFVFNDDDFRFLSNLAYDRTGIVLAEHKKDLVYSRLAKRLRTLNLRSFSTYCDLLRSEKGADEVMNMINALTTNLTRFFREEHHFEHLRKEIILPMLKEKNKRLRIWSAGCSSGMEPYSIAMTMSNAVPAIQSWDARILASDIDSNMLDTASAGEYKIAEIQHIPDSCRRFVQYTKNAPSIRMEDDLKSLIAFRQLNLLDSWPMKGPFDAIFCRNVVIYFDKPTKAKLFSRFADILKPGGWLYIGHSENLHGISDRFQLIGQTIYRKVK